MSFSHSMYRVAAICIVDAQWKLRFSELLFFGFRPYKMGLSVQLLADEAIGLPDHT